MHPLDWLVIAAYTLAAVVFALWFARRHRGHASGEDYMVADRRLPWWVVGIADVATSGGADAFWTYVFFVGGFMGYYRFFWVSLVVALPLEVVWARYWRRLRLASPNQLFEVRYGGAAAARFRAFSAIYGALITTSVVLGYVLQGFAQSLAPFIGWPQDVVLLLFCGTTLLYTLLSGLVAVAYSDVAQFVLMMLGRILLAAILLGAMGGLGPVLDRIEQVRGAGFLQPYPPSLGAQSARYGEFAVDPLSLLALIAFGLISVANTSNPVIQKSLAAKNELHAAVGQVFNAVLSLLVRVLPMALVGMVAIAVFPPGRKDTNLWADLVRAHARPGLTGLLLVGIVAGYMSCLDGLVNFSAAGLLNDVYRRYIRPGASDREQVRFGRLATLLVMGMAYLWARVLIGKINGAWLNFINSVIGLFMLPLGLLRWSWWRLNIWGEVVGFVVSGPLAYVVWFGLGPVPAFKDRPYWQAFSLLAGLGWGTILTVTLCTRQESAEVLRRFYLKARPPGFWGPVAAATGLHAEQHRKRATELWYDLGTVLLGLCFTGSLVVGLGAALSRRYALGAGMGIIAAAAALGFVVVTVRGERLRARLLAETGPILDLSLPPGNI